MHAGTLKQFAIEPHGDERAKTVTPRLRELI
jgi:hypothetical protein